MCRKIYFVDKCNVDKDSFSEIVILQSLCCQGGELSQQFCLVSIPSPPTPSPPHLIPNLPFSYSLYSSFSSSVFSYSSSSTILVSTVFRTPVFPHNFRRLCIRYCTFPSSLSLFFSIHYRPLSILPSFTITSTSIYTPFTLLIPAFSGIPKRPIYSLSSILLSYFLRPSYTTLFLPLILISLLLFFS